MKCSSCDKTVTGTFNFCPYCGVEVVNDSPAALLTYIQTQKERIIAKGQDAGRWIKWEEWVAEQLKETEIKEALNEGRSLLDEAENLLGG